MPLTPPHSWILVLDPSPTVQTVLQLELARAGWLVYAFADPQAALSCLRTAPTPPAALILELVLPGVDAFALLHYVRQQATRVAFPVLVLTTLDTVSVRREARLCGCQTFLTKPFKVQDLILELELALAKAAWQRQQGEEPQ